MKWHTEKRKVKDLIPYEHNPRQMTEKQDKDLERSLDTFDLVEIPAINTDNTILAGHQRCRKLLEKGRGEEKIDVRVPNKKLTEKQVKEYNIRSNRNLGGWDFDKLANNFDMPDLVDWGFEEWEFGVDSEVAAKEDDYEIPEEIKTDIVIGNLFEIGNHRLLCGDSTVVTDVERLMNGEKADMVFTDPPYGVNYEGGVIHGNKINKNHKRDKLQNDDVDIYSDFMNLLPLIIDNGALYCFYATRNSYEIFKALKDNKITVMAVLAWIKINTGYADMNSHYKNRYEPCVYCKIGDKTNFVGSTSECTTWEIEKDRDNKLHPTQKPISVPYRAIKNHTANIIADLFLGSGSTMVASHQLNRKCYGMELDPKYCAVIIDRMKKLDPDIIIKKNGHL